MKLIITNNTRFSLNSIVEKLFSSEVPFHEFTGRRPYTHLLTIEKVKVKIKSRYKYSKNGTISLVVTENK